MCETWLRKNTFKRWNLMLKLKKKKKKIHEYLSFFAIFAMNTVYLLISRFIICLQMLCYFLHSCLFYVVIKCWPKFGFMIDRNYVWLIIKKCNEELEKHHRFDIVSCGNNGLISKHKSCSFSWHGFYLIIF